MPKSYQVSMVRGSHDHHAPGAWSLKDRTETDYGSEARGRTVSTHILGLGIVLVGVLLLAVGLIMGLEFPKYVHEQYKESQCVVSPDQETFSSWNKMSQLIPFVFLSLFMSLCGAAPRPNIEADKKHNDDWEFLLLAQFWPSTSCIYFRESGCDVPEQVHNWTVHGLWPSRLGESQPENCNESMRFNYTLIESLRSRLDVQWPYYNKSGERTYLWEHEWNKHGTCANDLPILSGEMNYFAHALNLYQNINLSGVLKEAQIVPSQDKTYSAQAIYNAVESRFQVKPNIVCYFDRDNETYYLEEIWLCFNKNLTMRDCDVVHNNTKRGATSLKFSSERNPPIENLTSYIKDCPRNGNVNYQPIPNRIQK
ncbi:hypothetical protein Btru_017900 [Bulinus truncatus]|nr:hypothetical protein Btru_017900 [Bulinus truncatus]